jgi:PAS domain S-box-containing protein
MLSILLTIIILRQELSPLKKLIKYIKSGKVDKYKFFASNELGEFINNYISLYVSLEHSNRVLQESEEMYRRIVESAQEGIWTVDANGVTTFVNEKMSKMLGYSDYEMLGNNIFTFMDEEQKKSLLKSMNKWDQSITGQHEYRFIRKNGTTLWTLLSVNPLFDKDGIYSGSIAMVIDITQRKQIEKINHVSYEIANAVHNTKDLNELYKSIRSNLHEIVDTTNFFIALYDSKKNSFTLPYMVDEKIHFSEFPPGKTLTAYIIRNDKPLFATEEDINQLIQKGQAEIIGAPSKIWLGVPLKSGNEIIGAVVVQSYTSTDLYTEGHLEILKFVSGQIAMAIERKTIEEKIKVSLHEKELLLKEIHHRVKNNLQIISSLLNLQSKYIDDDSVLTIFKESQTRVKSMALIHEKLYQSPDLSRIDFSEYIQGLVKNLYRAYKIDHQKISFKLDVNNIQLGIHIAIPTGLIINELIANSLKYAFPDNYAGNPEIVVSLTTHNHKKFILIISDNGIGIPKNISLKGVNTLGLYLVSILVKDQLNGEIKIFRQKGTKFRITFNEK